MNTFRFETMDSARSSHQTASHLIEEASATGSDLQRSATSQVSNLASLAIPQSSTLRDPVRSETGPTADFPLQDCHCEAPLRHNEGNVLAFRQNEGNILAFRQNEGSIVSNEEQTRQNGTSCVTESKNLSLPVLVRGISTASLPKCSCILSKSLAMFSPPKCFVSLHHRY